MSRIAVVSDLHSNLQAVTAVFARIAELGCETIWCLGDVVGYGACPVECLDMIRSAGAVCVQGNHDAAVAGVTDVAYFNPNARAAVDHNRALLSEEALAYLANLPARRQFDDGTVLAHGSPDDRDRYLEADFELEMVRSEDETNIGAGVTFYGHTHGAVWHGGHEVSRVPRGPHEMPEGRRVLVNPGSVGQPRDGDARAAFAWRDPERNEIVYERVTYDIGSAQAAIRAAGLPERLAERLALGR